jgi:predicted RNA methylase
LEFFESQPPVVGRIIELAQLESWMSVLEPEAGSGAIAKAAAAIVGFDRVFCVEYFAARIRDLREAGFSPLQADFLGFNLPKTFDRVLMNPPFRHQADIDHATKAWGYLKRGGRLVSVMSSGTVTRNTNKARVFQQMLDKFGYYENLPDGSFKDSGTGVSTVLVVMDKPAV